MANYIEYIRSGSGETWPVRDAETHDTLVLLDEELNSKIDTLNKTFNHATTQNKIYSLIDDNGDYSMTTSSSYPTKAGVYKIASPIVGIPSGANYYGCLIIFNAGGYTLHIYGDFNRDLYWSLVGTSNPSEIPTHPTTWYKLTSTSINAITE